MNRLAKLAIAAAVLAGPMLTSGGAGASATDDGLRLSTDGSSWATALELPLFDATRAWIPGDEQTVAFWVQNNTDDPASLTVEFVGSDGPSLLDVSGVSLTASVDGQRRSIIADVAATLVAVGRVEARADRRIELTVALDPTTTNDAQGDSFDVALVVTLTEVAGPGSPEPPAPAPPAGGTAAPAPAAREPRPLPTTGLSAGWELGAAALLVLAGSLLLAHRGRGHDAGR